MTNWMTAAGIAFIAGGIATLICLRSVIFGRSDRPATRARGRSKQSAGRTARPDARPVEQREHRRPALESTRLRPALPPAAPTETAHPDLPTARRASWSEFDRQEMQPSAFDHSEFDPTPFDQPEFEPPVRRPETPRQSRRHASREDDLPGGLASIGLAEEAPAEPDPELPAVTPGDEESRPISVRRVDRSDPAYGNRVDGWVRPEYQDDRAESPSGEYWTPVPMDDLDLPEDDPEPSARGYGWPIPVERLPAVPDYEPATGFDLTPVASEPTDLIPAWPPLPEDRRRRSDKRRRSEERRRRIEERGGLSSERRLRVEETAGRTDEPPVRLPIAWAGRDTKPADNRFLENEPRRPRSDDGQRFRAPSGEPERRRPRPRPRPAAGSPDNVYVSRHAADPPL